MNRIKIVLLVNNLTSVQSPVYGNHISLIAYTAKAMPNVDFLFMNPYRTAIDTARNSAAKLCLETNADYLMFLDDDVLVPRNTVQEFLKSPADIQAALVLLRGYPFHTMAWQFEDHDVKDIHKIIFADKLPLEDDGSLRKAENGEAITEISSSADGLMGIGFSCALIRREVLQVLSPPWFVTGAMSTEDFYFCAKVWDELEDVNFSLRLDIQCGHLMNPEPVEFKTRKKFQTFYEDWAKDAEEGRKKSQERPLSYIDECKAEIAKLPNVEMVEA